MRSKDEKISNFISSVVSQRAYFEGDYGYIENKNKNKILLENEKLHKKYWHRKITQNHNLFVKYFQMFTEDGTSQSARAKYNFHPQVNSMVLVLHGSAEHVAHV